MPLAGAFALDPEAQNDNNGTVGDDTASVEIDVTIEPNIAISLDAASVSVTMDTKDMDEGMTTTATVSTNDTAGYTLTVKDSDATTALTSGSYTIPTGTSVAAGTAAWGIKGGDLNSYTAMVASTAETPVSVKANGTALAADETTTVTYGVSTAANQQAGTYTDTIVYTATAKSASAGIKD